MTNSFKIKLYLQICIYSVAILWSLPTLIFSAADLKLLTDDIYYFIIYFLSSACYITSLMLILAFCILLLRKLYRKCCLFASWGLMSANGFTYNMAYCMKFKCKKLPFCYDKIPITILSLCLLMALYIVINDFQFLLFAKILGWTCIALSTFVYLTSGVMLTPVAGYFVLLSFTSQEIYAMKDIFYAELLEGKLKSLKKKYDWRRITVEEYNERCRRLIDKYTFG